MKISKHFSRKEFLCKGNIKGLCSCNFDTVDIELIKVLEDVREYFKCPITIYSGCRCEKYNKFVGGVKFSKHRLGIASDIHVHGYTPLEVHTYLNNKYPNKYGLGLYDNFVHVDVRHNKARWYA